MSLKGLTQFSMWNWQKFSEGKTYLVTNVLPWVDFETKKNLGTKIEVVILEDNTIYASKKDGTTFNNKFEKLTIKIKENVDVPLNSKVTFEGVVAKVYSEFQNQLSIVAEKVTVLSKLKE
ncbi:hypothetical protein BCR24_07670 [Enterococcus ureilyticus]|uniref:Uncharacterized protein n=1 Tax=Enterococcus ureilyticus TaxID=1131292 RepID=A0A1E5H929_9ENTE|nr:hypothetical protein [Enterococcus ureilyticus]MBM7687502.1 hypothetical protein [Enterococcus ureilyticus]OEG21336.1 hypothetical protein BCR24_07670 [Enterococcus ureilyticus]